jgi:hypothetical protein
MIPRMSYSRSTVGWNWWLFMASLRSFHFGQQQVARGVGIVHRFVAAAPVRVDPCDQSTMGIDYLLAPSRAVYAQQGPSLGLGLRTL